MAVAFVQKNSGQSGSASTTLTATLTSAPTAGNLLVFAMGGDKNTGALTLAGFTQAYSLLSTSVSLYVWYKVSDGSETSINPAWASSSQFGNTYHYAEYADASVAGDQWQISGQDDNPTNETNAVSWSTGTTGTITDDGLAMAFIALDSADSVVNGTTAWTNSFTARHTVLSTAGARGSINIAEKSVTAGGTAESTFSYTASTTNRDQMSGAIVVFTKVSNDLTTESRGIAAAHGYVTYSLAFTPHARSDAAAAGAAEYVKHIRAGTYATGGAQGRAQPTHHVTVAAGGAIAAHARVPLVAGPNDVTKAVRTAMGAHARVPIIATFPAPVPAWRTYRIQPQSRVYRIARGNAMGLSKTILADESDDLDYQYDWDDVLEPGETIVDSVVEPPPGITAHDQTNGTRTTDVWFAGGTPGTTYPIPNRITTSAGRTYERNINLKIQDR